MPRTVRNLQIQQVQNIAFNMPRGHKTHSEARRELLEASKEWKQEMAKPKTVATLVAATVGALDSVVAIQNFLLDTEEALEAHVTKNTEGWDSAKRWASRRCETLKTCTKNRNRQGRR